jgi:hypothetical protein
MAGPGVSEKRVRRASILAIDIVCHSRLMAVARTNKAQLLANMELVDVNMSDVLIEGGDICLA